MNEKFWGVLLFVTALCWLNIHIHTFRNTQWAILQYDRCETNVIFFGRFSCYTEKCSRITTIGNNNEKNTKSVSWLPRSRGWCARFVFIETRISLENVNVTVTHNELKRNYRVSFMMLRFDGVCTGQPNNIQQ